MRDEVTDLSFPLGGVAGVAAKLYGWLSGVGEIGAQNKKIAVAGSDLRFSVYSFMAGVRASGRIGHFTQFGQVLVGRVEERGTAFQITSSRTTYGLQVGTGVDYDLSRKLAVRFQVDVRTAIAGNKGTEPGPQVRLLAGIARKFRQ